MTPWQGVIFCGEILRYPVIAEDKTAPSIPGTVDETLLRKKLRRVLAKAAELLVAALDADLQRPPVIQTEHADKAFSVDLLLLVAHHYLKGLHHCQRHKVLHLTEGTDANIELTHQNPPILYKF